MSLLYCWFERQSRKKSEKVSLQVSLLTAVLNVFIFDKLDIGRRFFSISGSHINNDGSASNQLGLLLGSFIHNRIWKRISIRPSNNLLSLCSASWQ